jgi:hypothetical protein
MKTPRSYFGALALFCVIALFIGMVSAADAHGPDGRYAGNKTVHNGPVKMLDRLEKQGYDISSIRTAFASGAIDVAHRLMQQFTETHKDLMPARNATERSAPGFGPGMMEDRLAWFEAKGYDVSSIRAAAESGDRETVRTLMQQFMEAHKDLMPARHATDDKAPGFGSGITENRLSRLEAKGYDVTAIRAAVQSGDTTTARSLLQQFIEAHKDELPRPGPGRNSTWSKGVAIH